MMHAPVKSQNASSDCQFQKDQPEVFLWQFNYPNPIKKNPPSFYSTELALESFRAYAIASTAFHPLETGTAQQAATISQQKL